MSNAVEAIEGRMSSLTAPLAGPKPAGEDLSFDPDFERVKAEIDKIGRVSSGAPDWALVATSSAQLLARTKDMRVATWFAAGRMNQGGWSGLAEGLVVLRAFVTKHWDVLYPERRPRARANIFAWLTENVVASLGVPGGTAPDREAIAACEVLFKELDSALSDKLGELHPGLGTVRSVMASCLASAPAAIPPAAPAQRPLPQGNPASTDAAPRAAPPAIAESPPVSAGTATSGTAPVAPPSLPPPPALPKPESLETLAETLSKCRETVLAAAALLRTKSHADAWAYALQRTAIWMNVRALPPTEESGKTYIPPPPAAMRNELEAHAAASRWLPLLRQAEPATSSYLFWLDLHRYVAVALENLGPDCEEAARIVRSTVSGLVDRFPGVPKLTFRDGTPFANAQTQSWLNASRQGVPEAAQTALAERKAEEDKLLAAARQEVASGRVGEGIGLLLELARRAPDGRTRFDMELEAAQLALDASKATLARPILDGLVSQIETHGLDAWEPSRCVRVYAALLSALRAINPPIVDAKHRETSIIDKLCRLDPVLAVRLGV